MTMAALQFALNRLFVVTSNLGTVFEDLKVEDNWLAEFDKVVVQADPDLVALHCQEIGGKDFENGDLKLRVSQFIRKLRSLKCFVHFDRIRGWFDGDNEYAEDFTALGSLYIFHKRVEPVFLWNFQDKEFQEVKGEEILCESLSSNHSHTRKRFPNNFYPGVKWSRKGYLHTRWRLFGSRILNFVNVHLFHDDDNLIALEESPSVYCGYRRTALLHALQSIDTSIGGSLEPLYIYGDFNFRLDFSEVIKHIVTSNHQTQFVRSDNGVISRIVYRNTQDSGELTDSEAVVTVERKKFIPRNGAQFTEKHAELLQYDVELKHFTALKELPITFQPSYPFSEDIEGGKRYMDKRCPAWCDRILMNESGLQLVRESPLGCMYNLMAKDICVGDHKPIYLFFTVTSTTPMRQLPDENLDA